MALSAGTRQAVGMATGWARGWPARLPSAWSISAEIKSVARVVLGPACARPARRAISRAPSRRPASTCRAERSRSGPAPTATTMRAPRSTAVPSTCMVDSGASHRRAHLRGRPARRRLCSRQRLHPARQHRQRHGARGTGHARPRQHRRHHRAQRAGGRERAGQARRPRCSACRSWAGCSASTCAPACWCCRSEAFAALGRAVPNALGPRVAWSRGRGLSTLSVPGVAVSTFSQGVRSHVSQAARRS